MKIKETDNEDVEYEIKNQSNCNQKMVITLIKLV